MNQTIVFWDALQGDLVCGSNGDKDYEFSCMYMTKFLASLFIFNALWFLRTAHSQIKLIEKFKSTAAVQPEQTSVNKSSWTITTRTSMASIGAIRVSKEATMNHGVKLTLTVGISTFFSALCFLVCGNGTIYSASSDIRGKIGAGFFAIHIFTAWYMNLLQYQGAKWFKTLVQLPEVNVNTGHNFAMPSVSQILDTMQGPLGPVLAIVLWISLITEHMTPSWYYWTLTFLCIPYGLRSFAAIVSKRISTLRRVAEFQAKAGGTINDKRRRQGILKTKAVSLAVDLLAVFLMTCFNPSSFLLMGSYFSSRQLIIHLAITQTFTVASLLIVNIDMHIKIKKAKRKRKINRSKLKSVQSDVPNGLSVVEESGVGLGANKKKKDTSAGLFSEFSEVNE